MTPFVAMNALTFVGNGKVHCNAPLMVVSTPFLVTAARIATMLIIEAGFQRKVNPDITRWCLAPDIGHCTRALQQVDAIMEIRLLRKSDVLWHRRKVSRSESCRYLSHPQHASAQVQRDPMVRHPRLLQQHGGDDYRLLLATRYHLPRRPRHRW